MTEMWERLKVDYERTVETYWRFAEIRFKLLAFVPTISGAAIALLTRTPIPHLTSSILAGLGFFVTLGIILYDQRNTQFYNGAVSRAQHLEAWLGFKAFERDKRVGLFGSRDEHPKWRFFGISVKHDLGLAIVYGSVLGAWAFAVMRGAWPSQGWLAALTGIAIAVVALIQFEWHDHKPKRVWLWWNERKRTRGSNTIQDGGRKERNDGQ